MCACTLRSNVIIATCIEIEGEASTFCFCLGFFFFIICESGGRFKQKCSWMQVFMCTPVSQNVSVHVHTSVPEYECSCAHQCPRIRVFMCTPVSQNTSVHVHTSVPECECSCAHQCPRM